ncbi:PRD domain-containing protein [Streptococcus dentiloxodontae]
MKKYIKDIVYDYICSRSEELANGVITSDLAYKLNMQRSNVSAILNQLVRENKLIKSSGRPVIYFLNTIPPKDESSFKYLVGNDSFLKKEVDLAKAGLNYPDFGLASLIIGEKGTGKSYFAKLMYQFALSEKILPKGTKYIEVNCIHHLLKTKNSDDDMLVKILNHSKGQFIFINHINVLDENIRSQILEKIEQQNKDFFLVCSIDETVDIDFQNYFSSKFPVCLKLPKLVELNLNDRLELIMHFFKNEVNRLGKNVFLNEEIIRNLLLYPCQENIKELKKDIRLACAKAYLREMGHRTGMVTIYMQDFSINVHKGFMFYSSKRMELEKLISEKFSYVITPEGIKKEKVINQRAQSVYNKIDERVALLREEGISNHDIQTIISKEIDDNLKLIHLKENNSEQADREAIVKITGKKLMRFVEVFLKACSHELKQDFSEQLLGGLTLYLYSAINNVHYRETFSQEEKKEILASHPRTFNLSRELIKDLNNIYSTNLGDNEISYIVLFLLNDGESNRQPQSQSIQLLVTMHGRVSESIVAVTKDLINNPNLHYYNLLLQKDLKTVYEELKYKIIEIDNGRGIVVLYDMGSIKAILETISKETGIYIKAIAIPMTLIVLECVRNLENASSIDDFYRETLELIGKSFQLGNNSQKRLASKKVIITLCMSGQGAALSMKNYIEKHCDNAREIEIIPLAMENKSKLKYKINLIQEEADVICLVGTINPKISGLKFISANQLYGAPLEQLTKVLMGNYEVETIEMDYSEIYKYLKEQQPSLNISRLKRVLPRCVKEIKKYSGNFSSSKEVGFFIHLACLISHLQKGKRYPQLPNVDRIIATNKKIYYKLKEVCFDLEIEFGIQIPEGDYANMIRMIKEI